MSGIFVDAIPPDAPVAIVLVEQDGCDACAEFHPVFVELATPYAEAGLPILRLDANSQDPMAQAFMAKHHVRATPTLLLVPKYAYGIRVEAQDPASIKQALDWANGLHQPRAPWWQG